MAGRTLLSNKTKAIGCILASAFGFALMGMCVRLADDFGTPLSTFQKAFFRNLVAFFIALALFVRGNRPQREAGAFMRALPMLLLRSTLGAIGIFTNFYALSHIHLCDAMMLNKLAPFFTILFAWLFLGERVLLRQGLCVLGALGGAALVIRPGFAGTALFPVLMGFSSGVCAGGAYACVRKLGIMKVDGSLIVLFFSAFSCVASVPFMVVEFTPMTLAQLGILIGAGAAAALGQFGVTAAYRLAEPREVAVYDYSNVVFAALLGWIAFAQMPDLLSVLGFAIIIAMGLVIRGRKSA